MRSWMIMLDGARLRELRRAHGLTQAGLAARAGISTATVTRLELRPATSCRGRTPARLAAALGERLAAISFRPGVSVTSPAPEPGEKPAGRAPSGKQALQSASPFARDNASC